MRFAEQHSWLVVIGWIIVATVAVRLGRQKPPPPDLRCPGCGCEMEIVPVLSHRPGCPEKR